MTAGAEQEEAEEAAAKPSYGQLDGGLHDKAGGQPGMYPQMVEVPKYFVEEEKTTTTGIDRHIPVWPLVEQNWAGAREGDASSALGNGKQGADQAGSR